MNRYSYHRAFQAVAGTLAVVWLAGCAATPATGLQTPEHNLQWPPAPSAARIVYKGSFASPADLGIKESTWRRLGSLFTGSQPQHLVRPVAVFEAADGSLWISDPGIKGVHYFDLPRGRYRVIRRKKNQPLPSPIGLAQADNGDMLISDSALGRVFRVPRGKYVAQALTAKGALKQPTGLAYLGGKDRFVVADTLAHQLKVFTTKGEPVGTIGSRGDGPGQFNFPTMVWRDQQHRLWVTDSLNFRIQALAEDGTPQHQFGKLGDGSGRLSRPKGVATDNQGHVYVVDALFHAMQVFDEQGRLLLYLGQQGQAPGQFWLPTGITIGSGQKIYIADTHNRRVQVFQYVGGQS